MLKSTVSGEGTHLLIRRDFYGHVMYGPLQFVEQVIQGGVLALQLLITQNFFGAESLIVLNLPQQRCRVCMCECEQPLALSVAHVTN